jgi:hypothetical protein
VGTVRRVFIAGLAGALVVLLTLVAACGAGSSRSGPSSTAVTETDVRVVNLFTETDINPTLKVLKTVNGQCWTGSIAAYRPDAWRCSGPDHIMDPCFSSDGLINDAVVCPEIPWSNQVTVLRLAAPLPRDSANPVSPGLREPWYIELSNGKACGALTGSTASVAGEVLNYVCQGGGRVYGSADKSQPVWTELYQEEGVVEIVRTGVRVAWY